MAVSASDVKVLGTWASAFLYRVQIALNLKSIDYEYVEESLSSKSDLLLKHNPVHKKIPVLIHADRSICESLNIVRYIDETWTNGPSILPSDPYDRAVAHFWAACVEDKWIPLMRDLKYAQDAEDEGREAEVMGQLDECMVVLEEAFVDCSKGKGYFGGESIGYVDIALGCFLGWIKAIEKTSGVKLIDRTKNPGLLGWADRFILNDAVKDVMPRTQKLIDLIKMVRGKAKASSN